MSKKILVTKAVLPEMDEYISEIKDIWDSHWLTNMGPKHIELQNKLKDYLEVDNIDLMVNGHMALELSIQAMNLKGEVITTPFTFASTTHAIVRNNLTPVFCDIDPKDFTIDTSKIEELITDRTTAILPVHVYGNICDVDSIQSIADKYGLKVIYDAAHAFGVKRNGHGIAAYGDVSCFSFHATKVYNTIEGGAVCFHNEDMGRKLNRLKNFGIRNEEIVDDIGANAKMNEFCAAMGLCNLRNVDEMIRRRGLVVQRYRERLERIKGIQLNVVQPEIATNNAYFPIVVHEKEFGRTRNEVVKALCEKGFYPRKYFYPLCNTFECYNGKYDVNKTPIALHISNRVLTLPLYPDLPLNIVDKICDVIGACSKGRAVRT